MFRFGITEKAQIPTEARDFEREPAIAFTLLTQFQGDLSEADEARLIRLYESVKAGPVTHMRTFPRRYEAVDEAIETEIAQRFPGRNIAIHEVAASNAITSLEMFERLKNRFGDRISVQATDYFDALYVVAVVAWSVVFDAERQPLQFVGRRLVISAHQERRRYPINRIIRKVLMAKVLPEAIATRMEARRIDLFHPRCLALAARDGHFTLAKQDAFAPAGSCDILRAMNLWIYPADRAPELLAKACRPIVDGGLLVIGTTPDGYSQVAATVFQRRVNRFAAIRDIGLGYETKNLVLELILT